MVGRALAAFEDRYGDGAFERLRTWLEQPCVTFADIATRFGVSRERVRQWHRQLLPDAPTGHERQRLCALQRKRRDLFRDPLFREFFRHARAHFGPGRIVPIRTRNGYRTRAVAVDGRLVALREQHGPGAVGTRPTGAIRYRGAAEFIFVRLSDGEFAFVPARLPTTDARFRNSFAAWTAADPRSLTPDPCFTSARS